MGSIIGGLFFIAVALVIGYFCVKHFRQHFLWGIVGLFCALMVFFFGVGGMSEGFDQVNHTGDYSPKAIAESKHKVSESKAKQSSKAESKSESKAESSSISKAQNKAKSQGITDLNNKIAQQPGLNGLKVKRDTDVGSDDYTVTVPDEVAMYSDNEQKEAYRHINKLITQYTGSTDPTTIFEDSTGGELAHTTWTGDIKLDN